MFMTRTRQYLSRLLVFTLSFLLCIVHIKADYDNTTTSQQPCSGCQTVFGGSVILVGTPVTMLDGNVPVIGSPTTLTQSCTGAVVVDNNGRLIIGDCWGMEDLNRDSDSILTIGNGQSLDSVSTLSTIFDVYTSINYLPYKWACILDSSVVRLNAPITIDASQTSHLTILSRQSYTETILYPSYITETIPFSIFVETDTETSVSTVFNSNISTYFPTAMCSYSTPATRTAASSSETALALKKGTNSSSTTVSNLPNELSRASKVVLGITAASGVLMIVVGLAFAIWWRSISEKGYNKTQKQTSHGLSSIRKDNKRGIYTKMTANAFHYPSNRVRTSSWIWIWRSPLIIFASLICGLSLAIGHHYLYQNINGHPITDFQVSQTWYLRIGTLLAFLVKLSFALSVSAAFVQLQWLKLHQAPLRVKDIDALSNVLENLSSFLESSVWLQFPSLTMLALIFWLLAATPIITPGTLNMTPLSFHNTSYVQVPQLDFSNATKWTSVSEEAILGSRAVRQVTKATAISGQILSLSPYLPNGRWRLDFEGPALKCTNANEKAREFFMGVCQVTTVPGPVYISQPLLEPEFPYQGPAYGYSGSRYTMVGLTDCGTCSTLGGDCKLNITQCGLFNAKYSVNFASRGSEQNITILSIDFLNGISWDAFGPVTSGFKRSNIPNTINSPTGVGYPYNQEASYLGLMAEVNSLLVGYIEGEPQPLAQFTSIDLLNFDYASLTPQEWQPKLEELVQNITISLLSNQDFQKNSTIADWIEVRDDFEVLSYFYNSFDLILTYSVAFIATTISAMLGLYASLLNRGSYQNRFSTFIRATRNDRQLRSHIEREDRAADPRPKGFTTATVQITS